MCSTILRPRLVQKMSVRYLLIFIVLYTSIDLSLAKKDNYKHVFMQESKEKDELVDKLWVVIEASWDYMMQLLYYKADFLGLAKDHKGSMLHHMGGSSNFGDFLDGVMDVFLEDVEDGGIHRPHHRPHHHRPTHNKKKKPKPHGGHHGGHGGHGGLSDDDNIIVSHISTVGSLLDHHGHHGRSFVEDMANSGLHKLLVRWRLCDE